MSNNSTITIGWETKQNLKEKKLSFERKLQKCISWDTFFEITEIILKDDLKSRGKK